MSDQSTSPDLVELTRQAIEDSRRGDYGAALSVSSVDVVWESLDGLGVFEGATAVRRFLEDFGSAYESFQTDPEQILDIGGGIIFAVIRHTGHLRGAGGPVEGRYAWGMAWEHGRVVHVIAGGDIGKVRAAAERLAEERA